MSETDTFDPVALIAVAVAHIDDDDTTVAGEARTDPAWNAIEALQRSGSRNVLDLCTDLCLSADPRARRVCADVLGQLGVSNRQASTVFTEERFRALHGLLADEVGGPADTGVISAACIALGHLHDPRAIPAVASLREHPNPVVRNAVVHGLLGYDIEEAVAALIALSADVDARVRDWATFGLSQQGITTTSAVRAALAARIADPDGHIRQEAFVALRERDKVSIYAEVEGGSELIQHFGRVPSFHDGEILCLHLDRDGPSSLRIHGWVTTDRVGSDGTLVLEHHAVVTFTLQGVMDLQLDDFSRQNVIGGLILRRPLDRPDRRNTLALDPSSDDIEIELVPCYGLNGLIRARSVVISFEPGEPGGHDG